MEYKSANSGILNIKDVEDGMKLRIIGEAYINHSEKYDKDFWNVKVELPDGTHKLGSLNKISGDNFLKNWGSETKDWLGRFFIIRIRESRNTGNLYMVFETTEDRESIVSEEELRSDSREETKVEYPKNDINPDEIPF